MDDSTKSSFPESNSNHTEIDENDPEDDDISVTDPQESSQVSMAVSLETGESTEEKEETVKNNADKSDHQQSTPKKVQSSNEFSIDNLKSGQTKFLHHDSIHAGKRMYLCLDIDMFSLTNFIV